jgi:hypothetical protein
MEGHGFDATEELAACAWLVAGIGFGGVGLVENGMGF